MTGSAKQSIADFAASEDWIASELTLLAMTKRVRCQRSPIVTRGLVPRIQVLLSGQQDVDGRGKPGHDDASAFIPIARAKPAIGQPSCLFLALRGPAVLV
jgi:hypothetical protein